MSLDFKVLEGIDSDTIFDLFLKHNITPETSVKFVTEYLKTIDVSKMAIKFAVLFKGVDYKAIILLLEKDIDYFVKKEDVARASCLINLLNKKSKDKDFIIKEVKNIKWDIVDVIYITPLGIVALMDKRFKDIRTSKVEALFNKIVLSCVYSTEMSQI
jgi:hypothetical protein